MPPFRKWKIFGQPYEIMDLTEIPGVMGGNVLGGGIGKIVELFFGIILKANYFNGYLSRQPSTIPGGSSISSTTADGRLF